MNIKFFSQSLSVIAISCLMAVGVVWAWTEPTATPPGGNVKAPLNVGPDMQEKLNGLILNTGNAPLGLIVANGNVGIGTTTPNSNAKLDVAGPIRIQGQTSATCDGTTRGLIYYNSGDGNFYGCTGAGWRVLNNNL